MGFRNRIIFIISILVIVIGMGTVFSRRMQTKSVQLTSKTKVIEIARTGIVNELDFANISLKNVSTKNVNGIQISFNTGSLRIEFLDADETDRQRLIPGETYEQAIPLTKPYEPLVVNVLAVTFDDKSSDGDPQSVKEILDSRRGFNKELKRMKPFLEAALAATDKDSLVVLDKLKSQIENLSVEQGGDSMAFRQGQHAAREDFLYHVEFLRERRSRIGPVEIHRAFTKAKNRYDRRMEMDF